VLILKAIVVHGLRQRFMRIPAQSDSAQMEFSVSKMIQDLA